MTPEWARRRVSRHSAVTAPAACPGSTGRSLRGPVARRLVVDEVGLGLSSSGCLKFFPKRMAAHLHPGLVGWAVRGSKTSPARCTPLGDFVCASDRSACRLMTLTTAITGTRQQTDLRQGSAATACLSGGRLSVRRTSTCLTCQRWVAFCPCTMQWCAHSCCLL